MASAAEQLASNLNFAAFAKAEDLKKRIWFTLGALLVYRLGTYIPLPGINPDAFAQAFNAAERRHARHVQHVLRRRRAAHGDLRARHHALHLRLDHHAADDLGRAVARSAEEGRRAGPQGHQPVHALRHRAAGAGAGLRHRRRASRAATASSSIPAWFFRISTVDHAGRRHHVPDVARRADHRARHRQRHFADHLLRHRRQPAARHRRHAGTRPHRRAVDRPHPGHHRAGDRRHRASSSSSSAPSAGC